MLSSHWHTRSFPGPLSFRRLLEPLAAIQYAAKTLLLFTYSDHKCVLIPMALFGCVCGPVYSMAHFARGLVWIWLHLLLCAASNQTHGREEDAINKPWRPIPSGRISERGTHLLKLSLIPLCIGLSAIYGWDVALASGVLTVALFMYNDCSLSGHWIGKNVCNVLGYASFEVGVTKVMGLHRQLDYTATLAVLCSMLVILTTIQVQDFYDTAGDAMLGRLTFPMKYPRFSRVFAFAALIALSAFLSQLWDLGTYCTLLLCGLGSYVGSRFYRLREVKDDILTFQIYSIWLVVVHVLPAQQRWSLFSF